jgi:hypothetical protein
MMVSDLLWQWPSREATATIGCVRWGSARCSSAVALVLPSVWWLPHQAALGQPTPNQSAPPHVSTLHAGTTASCGRRASRGAWTPTGSSGAGHQLFEYSVETRRTAGGQKGWLVVRPLDLNPKPTGSNRLQPAPTDSNRLSPTDPNRQLLHHRALRPPELPAERRAGPLGQQLQVWVRVHARRVIEVQQSRWICMASIPQPCGSMA